MLPVPTRSNAPELLDAPAALGDRITTNLADIRRLNAMFGGVGPVVRLVRGMLGSLPAAAVLDVATGSGDIPLALVQRLSRPERPVHLVAVDVSPEVLAVARKHCHGSPVDLRCADARTLPFADLSFDVALCSLALHHFDRPDASRVLSEMWRVSRVGVVVTDLSRGYVAYLGTWLATRVLARSAVTHHDGPLSVLRAYTAGELRQLAIGAGIPRPTVRWIAPFRLALTARRGGEASG